MKLQQLCAVSVHKDAEDYLEADEFIKRANELDIPTEQEYDFYAKPENWKYLPKDVDVIVFPKTVFRRLDGARCVRYLYRVGSVWRRHYYWLGHRFRSDCLVAVLASTSQSDTKPSSDSLPLELPDTLEINGITYKKQ